MCTIEDTIAILYSLVQTLSINVALYLSHVSVLSTFDLWTHTLLDVLYTTVTSLAQWIITLFYLVIIPLVVFIPSVLILVSVAQLLRAYRSAVSGPTRTITMSATGTPDSTSEEHAPPEAPTAAPPELPAIPEATTDATSEAPAIPEATTDATPEEPAKPDGPAAQEAPDTPDSLDALASTPDIT